MRGFDLFYSWLFRDGGVQRIKAEEQALRSEDHAPQPLVLYCHGALLLFLDRHGTVFFYSHGIVFLYSLGRVLLLYGHL